MIEISKIEQIKKLIIKGFDLNLISFELDIPIEELERVKRNFEDSLISFSKMEQLRARYNKLYYSNNEVPNNSKKELSEKETEYINSLISEIEKNIKSIQPNSKSQAQGKLKEILLSLKEIEGFNISIEQAEKLYDLMNMYQIENLEKMKKDRVSIIIKGKRRRIIKKLADAVDFEQEKIYDIEELEKLEKVLTSKVNHSDPIIFGVINKIENKILKIRQKSIIDNIKNNIPESIEYIASKIASGDLDIDEVNEIINIVIQNKMENNTKSKFTLNEEQIRKQILIQITTLLMEKSEKYVLENPEFAIIALRKVYCGEIGQPIRIVIHNLINLEKFEEANNICNEYYKKYKDTELGKYILLLKKEVKNAEIANFVLKGIKLKGTEKQEREYYELIKKGINMGNVKITAVLLGKNEDGTKNIYLSDIWTEKVNYRVH